MLEPHQESATEVTRVDQDKINKFSTLLNVRVDLEDRLRSRKELLKLYEDASDEIMLMDEDTVQQAIGDVFLISSKESAEKRVEKTATNLREEIEKIEEDLLNTRSEMMSIKSSLYAKFGESINLEDDYSK
mmetsp:Transcript_15657/g.40151  ORF Transcript_15657/g.40151 Transcript_15657/m.40151 type:complete len:131 (+) Transcript_15657:153-545(+)